MVAALAVATLTANAQMWVGGSIGYDYTKADGADFGTNTLTVSPQVGYSFNDKWGIGLEIDWNHVKYDQRVTNDFGVALFARWTFAKAGIASFFLDGGVDFGSYSESLNGVGPDATTQFGIGVRPGIALNVSDHVSLIARAGFIGWRNVKDKYSQFTVCANESPLSLGAYYSF